MGLLDDRRGRVGLILVGVVAFTAVMLARVLATIFFAVSLVYVLYPLKRRLVDRGLSHRIAAGVVTLSAFVTTLALFAPLFVVLYRRRRLLFAYLETLPDEFQFELLGFAYVLQVESVVPVVREFLTGLAIRIASSAPVLAAKLFLLVFLLYAMLLRPEAVRQAVFGVVPPSHHDDVQDFHERIRGTLQGIYVVQAATAVLTFLVALVVFFLLGYRAFFTFAVLAAVLQFFPVVGPSIVVAVISAGEFLGGDPTRGVVTLVVGFVVIGALPDMILRPRLAQYATGLPASLYFVGFTAGALSFGAVGIIAGPVVIGILLEAIAIASREANHVEDAPDYFY